MLLKTNTNSNNAIAKQTKQKPDENRRREECTVFTNMSGQAGAGK